MVIFYFSKLKMFKHLYYREPYVPKKSLTSSVNDSLKSHEQWAKDNGWKSGDEYNTLQSKYDETVKKNELNAATNNKLLEEKKKELNLKNLF